MFSENHVFFVFLLIYLRITSLFDITVSHTVKYKLIPCSTSRFSLISLALNPGGQVTFQGSPAGRTLMSYMKSN